ncbi:copper resistance CopC family protein [Aneurinibacillus sp. REN35]|uniref:copper resistance CopC family protein n=1 Tax=Aneurinibacillus sp. REN35 TaxID=3237286 RepID=UPI00352953B3
MKKTVFFTVFLLMLMTSQVFAHSRIESSSPQNGEVVTKQVQEIAVQFSASIERVSKLEVKNEQGQTFAVRDVQASGKSLKATLDKPLPNGKYKVEWMNIGEDGHSLRGAFSFEVKAAPQEKPTEPKATEEPEQSQQQEQPTPQPSNADTENSAGDKGTSSFMAGFIIIALLVVGLVVFLLRKKS